MRGTKTNKINTVILCFAFLFIACNCQAQASKKDSTITFKVRKPVVSETDINQKNDKVKFQTGISTNVEFIPEIFIVAEQMPAFPGGEVALVNFIRNNINYPEDAKNTGASGTSYISFTVDTAGNIVNTQIRRTSGNISLDQEAIRLVNSMPAWNPGRQRGKMIPVEMFLPIPFNLK